VPENNAPPDAPVSYPFLWGSSWHDKVQWNGSAKNERIIDRLGRNVGEVLGVFAQAELEPPFPPFRTYETSINRPNLLRLELLLRRLDSPAWPERVLGAIDRDKAAAGREIFAKRCEGCHSVVPQGEQDTPVTVTMTPIDSRGLRTDPRMATNACSRTASTGRLEGARLGRVIEKLRQRLPARTKTLKLVSHVVAGAILSRPSAGDLLELARVAREKAQAEDSQLIEKLADSLSSGLSDHGEAAEQVAEFLEDREASDEADCGPRSPLMRYKSRPLDGIWATAPYLHNGSVANLYEILLPPEERMERFHVGSRRYDPERVGFATEPSPESTRFDTSLPGNSRLGHDYGNAKLSDEERWQLVEYMKTL
jgi:hypothetical protein